MVTATLHPNDALLLPTGRDITLRSGQRRLPTTAPVIVDL